MTSYNSLGKDFGQNKKIWHWDDLSSLCIEFFSYQINHSTPRFTESSPEAVTRCGLCYGCLPTIAADPPTQRHSGERTNLHQTLSSPQLARSMRKRSSFSFYRGTFQATASAQLRVVLKPFPPKPAVFIVSSRPRNAIYDVRDPFATFFFSRSVHICVSRATTSPRYALFTAPMAPCVLPLLRRHACSLARGTFTSGSKKKSRGAGPSQRPNEQLCAFSSSRVPPAVLRVLPLRPQTSLAAVVFFRTYGNGSTGVHQRVRPR